MGLLTQQVPSQAYKSIKTITPATLNPFFRRRFFQLSKSFSIRADFISTSQRSTTNYDLTQASVITTAGVQQQYLPLLENLH